MRYLIYMRVSTEKQEESGLGLEAQRHACIQWIQKNGGGEIFEYVDIVTGTDRKRKELEQRPKLLEALSEIKPGDTLIIAKRDRIGRDPYINCMIERIIEKKKGKFVSANGDMDGDEPHNILMRRIIDAFAEYEALMISTRTKLALARKKAKGERIGHIPYGYKLDGKKNLIVNPAEKATLKSLYDLRQQGLSFRDVAARLNDAGLYNRPDCNYPVRPWTYGAAARMYANYQVFLSASPSSFSLAKA